jgi:hypothetical protein
MLAFAIAKARKSYFVPILAMGPVALHISRGARDVMIETSSRRRCGEINMAFAGPKDPWQWYIGLA